MKKSLFIVLAAFTAVLAACNKPAERKTFHLTGFPELSFTYQGGSATFGIEANRDESWTLTCDADWIHVTQGFGNGDGARGTGDAALVISCGSWTKNSERTGTITVTGPDGTFSKTLTQTRKPVPEGLIRLKGSLSCSGGETRISLPEGYWVSADCDSEWMTVVSCEEGALVVSAGPNPEANRERQALVRIALSDGSPLAEVTVTQLSEEIPEPLD